MIKFTNVHKRFGKVVALDDFNLEIEQGKIVGFLAPNGAGKSTCLKMIAGLNKPDAGELLVLGEPVSVATKKKVAYLPEIDYLPNNMKIAEAKDFISGFFEDFNEAKYKDLLGFLELQEDLVIGKVSKGMRAKIKLLLTFSRDAEIVLLDEPLSGIDILTRDKIIDTIIRDFKEGEQTIVISTHEIDETENILEDVVFMLDGKIKLKENVEVLREQYNLSLAKIMKEVYRNAI